MNKKKIIAISLPIATVLIVSFLFIILGDRTDSESSLGIEPTLDLEQPIHDWEPPSSDWFLEFNSIEEINYVRELFENGAENDLIEFVQGAGNGNNTVEKIRDVEYFLEVFDSRVLPIDTNWSDFAYEYGFGMFFLMYDVNGADELSFIINLKEDFDQITEENASDYTMTDVTDEIATFANQGSFDEISLRIGNGVQAFSFYRHDTGMDSIRETEEGFTVSLSLNVKGNAVYATVSNASSLELAFEVLASIEFANGRLDSTE